MMGGKYKNWQMYKVVCTLYTADDAKKCFIYELGFLISKHVGPLNEEAIEL